VIIGLFGLLIGSFLNVVVYRVPIGKSIVSPPSACTDCGSEIKAYDNIPLISWIVLRGKCRNCGSHISARYPLVELGTGVLFFVVGLLFGGQVLGAPTLQLLISTILVLVAYLYLAAVSVALALIDLDVRRLPNVIVLPSYAVALVLFAAASVLSGDFSGLIRAGIAMAGLALAYFIMAIARPGGMGMGDVKLAGVLGIYLGWAGWGPLAVGALAAFVLGGVYGVILIASRRATRKSGVPFGPWMLAGAWLGVAAGAAIFSSYLSVFGLTAAYKRKKNRGGKWQRQ
jgi:leader peptidase (prepilin peptidase)/N-methyltransferase